MIDWRRLDHVQFPIPPGSEAEAREFYGGVLGLDEIPKPDSLRANGGLWFRAGDVELHLGVEAVESPPSKRHSAFEVGNLDHARAQLAANGVAVDDETAIPGRDRFSFRDPFGNRLELLQRR
jgi:catechol 2,3-dioxygenase-like lactoylglutathione lyase family enzyme